MRTIKWYDGDIIREVETFEEYLELVYSLDPAGQPTLDEGDWPDLWPYIWVTYVKNGDGISAIVAE